MAKSRKSLATPDVTLVHEVEHGTIRHRIVIVSGGVVDAGAWAEMHELAIHKGYLANLGSGSPIPVGIFKVRAYPTQVLDANG